MDKPREACGVFGIVSEAGRGDIGYRLAVDTYHALYALQHRGQTSAGIAVTDGDTVRYKKGDGLVQEVFESESLKGLTGHMAIGHVRYAAQRGTSGVNAQPLVVETLGEQIALVFNGNLTNAGQLRIETENQGGIFQTTGDAEVILYAIVRKLLNTRSLETAVLEVMPMLKGAYSILILTKKKVIAARDPHGFRPLCIGKRGSETVFASESCALDAVDATFERDVQPGEVVVASPDGFMSYTSRAEKRCALCAFEFVYFARPDSVIDGQSVEISRYLAGQCLARRNPADADVVIGIPDSGLSSALGYAQESGIPYAIGFVKNRYIGRTFIQEAQWLRERSLKIKINVLAPVVKGKRVVMVDDSIVRGTTTERVVSLVRESGAAEVHLRISSPPYMHPCYFGTDIPNRDQLPASRYTVGEMTKMVGADSLAFLSLKDLPDTMPDLRIGWCDACFTGEYPVPVAMEKTKGDFL
ncbi:MAG: amidophosphoribosyltransferase [Oscillospiraceae bacterium]|jgi:amidophosphoribosyltransferase|nr:amidophosphoribosyltransferase [Oscillospiraceae bacterium]